MGIYRGIPSDKPGYKLAITHLNGVSQVTSVSQGKWRKGLQINTLSGKLWKISPKEQEELSEDTDFSVVILDRTKETYILYGPIRLVHHHCRDKNTTVI